MTLKLVLFRPLTLIALATCCASLLNHLLPSAAFCGFRSEKFRQKLGPPYATWDSADPAEAVFRGIEGGHPRSQGYNLADQLYGGYGFPFAQSER